VLARPPAHAHRFGWVGIAVVAFWSISFPFLFFNSNKFQN
jgi:hypothetical protein